MDSTEVRLAAGNCIITGDARALFSLLSQYGDLLTIRHHKLRAIDSLLITCIANVIDDDLSLEMCRILHEFGADVNASDLQLASVGPIYRAARRSLKLVKWLHSVGATINHSVHGMPGSIPLLAAVHENQVDIAKYLIENGAVFNFVNRWRMSPLDYAANFPEMSAYLRSVGAKPGAELPQDHLPIDEPPPPDPTFESARDHLSFWYENVTEFPLHEIVPGDPPLRLLKVPNWDGGYVGIVTDGLSARAMNASDGDADAVKRAELLVLLSPEWPLTEAAMQDDHHRWPIDWLRQIARWPFATNSYLRRVNIISNGEPAEPLVEGCPFTSLMVRVVPHEEWGRWTRADGEVVELMVVTPLFTHERDYEQTYGIAALLELVNESPFGNLVWPTRPSFVMDD